MQRIRRECFEVQEGGDYGRQTDGRYGSRFSSSPCLNLPLTQGASGMTNTRPNSLLAGKIARNNSPRLMTPYQGISDRVQSSQVFESIRSVSPSCTNTM